MGIYIYAEKFVYISKFYKKIITKILITFK